jgi:hypothetical protein
LDCGDEEVIGWPITPRLLLAALLVSHASDLRADALERLKPDRLEAAHQAVAALRSQRESLQRQGPYRDYRANLHVHSALSHDSRGAIEEIVKAARAAGTSVLMFSEHPADHYDYFKDGHRGLKDGVLLIPGAETQGFLVYPTQSLRGLAVGPAQEFSDLVRGRGGLMFLSHLEERMSWEIRGLTGTEIYNTHADFKDEKNLMTALRNPLWIFKLAELCKKYPQECFSALQDYPADYLKRWDELSIKAPHTGVAANDAHQNIGLVAKLLDDKKCRIEDALGKKLLDMDVTALEALVPLPKGKKTGDIIYQCRLDPYENSLRHVGTHLLMKEQSEKAVWEALEVGRAFVAFDWLADATGFDFAVVSATGRHEMGSRVPFTTGLKLQAQAPLPVGWKLLRDGKIATEATGRKLDYAVQEPGHYRVEAWTTVAGEKMIWVLSNPIHVRNAR